MPDSAASIVDKVKQSVGGLLGRRGAPVQQTVTIARPVADVTAALRDPAVLSQALGETGRVSREADGGYRWTLGRHVGDGATGAAAQEPGADVVWDTVLVESPGALRWSAAGSRDDGPEVSFALREAPAALGTETTVRLALPAPGLAAGAAAYTLLYRLRALLQTGEVPTITPQPAARPSPR